jgi:hypothetical protein
MIANVISGLIPGLYPENIRHISFLYVTVSPTSRPTHLPTKPGGRYAQIRKREPISREDSHRQEEEGAQVFQQRDIVQDVTEELSFTFRRKLVGYALFSVVVTVEIQCPLAQVSSKFCVFQNGTERKPTASP